MRRILEINRGLPDDYKIRVIAMQVGWSPDQKGYGDIAAAVHEAKAAGIFVISSSLSETYGLHFHGLGRNPLTIRMNTNLMNLAYGGKTALINEVL